MADGNAVRHKDLYWFGPPGGVIPYVQFVLLSYLGLVCSSGYKQSREGRAPQVSRIGGKEVCVALVWLGQLPVITARSSACPFPSGESALICSDGVISRAFDHLELSPRPLCSLPFISKGEEPCTTERERERAHFSSLSLSYFLSFVSAFCLLIAHHNTF